MVATRVLGRPREVAVVLGKDKMVQGGRERKNHHTLSVEAAPPKDDINGDLISCSDRWDVSDDQIRMAVSGSNWTPTLATLLGKQRRGRLRQCCWGRMIPMVRATSLGPRVGEDVKAIEGGVRTSDGSSEAELENACSD